MDTVLQPQSEGNEIEKFKALFREIPAGLALLKGPEFIFEMANSDYIELIGNRDLIGKPLLEALPEIKDQPFLEILRSVLRTGETYHAREIELLLHRDPRNPTKLVPTYVDLTYRRILTNEGGPYGIFVFAIDMTEKVKARAAIQLEKLKLESVFANSSSSLALLRGPDAVFEKANSSYINLFNGRDLIDKPFLVALPELHGQKFPALVAQVYETGETYTEIEAIAYLRRDETSPLEKRFFDQSYSQISDTSGQRYGVLIHALDVTERVTNRQKLAESLEGYRIAIEAAQLGTWDVNLRTNLIDWSLRTCEIFGCPPSATILLEDAIKRIHPEDQARVQLAIAQAIDPAGDGNYQIDYRIVHDDGTIRWVSLLGKVNFTVVSGKKVAERFSGTVLDVSDRIASERKFRILADSMPQVVWTARADGILDYTNERWRQYSGSSDAEGWLNLVHPEDQARAMEQWSACVTSGERYEVEFRLLRHVDQAYRWFLVRADASRGTNRKIERWFGTCTDIQDQKAALAARSEFLSIASHELKTPLTSLKLQTQSIRRNYAQGKPDAFSNEKIISLIQNYEKQLHRLVRLVDDMLDFSKIESGKLPVTLESTDLCELVQDVYIRMKDQIDSSGSIAQFNCKEKIIVHVDQFRIEQVVINLITNALRYGRGKPITLIVERSLNAARVSVRDEGIGIAPENMERIFNRFERAVSANEVSGLGLGLYISKEIVVAHHGRIWVESTVGLGSTFFVELPMDSLT